MRSRTILQLLLASTAMISFPKSSPGQWTSIGNVDRVERVSDGVLVSAGSAKVRISIIGRDVVRVRMAPTGQFEPDSSWAIIQRKLGDEPFDMKESENDIRLLTPSLTVYIRKSPCRVSFLDSTGGSINQDEPTKGMSWAGEEIAVWKSMPINEYYFGFGEKAGALQRRAHSMSMWNSDIPAYHADTDPLYQSIPFFYANRNGTSYGIFFDNTYFSFFDMGKENPNEYSFGATGGELNYYFIYGPTPKEVNQKFVSLIGRMPLPPKWAIGYQQCRWSYYPDSRVREIASNFRTKKIPCDAIYLDIHYMNGYKCFTWDSTRFPNPRKLVTDLAHDGFKLVTIIDPGIKDEPGYRVFDEGEAGDHFIKYPNGSYFVGKVWPGECMFPDFTRDATRTWWGTLYKGLVSIGVRGFWNDMNEPSVFDVPTKTVDLNVMHDGDGIRADHRRYHNIYGMQMVRATYEGVMKLQPNQRPFVLTRADYAGGNRYAAAWTGDNVSSWEHLEMAIPMCLNLSVSGQPFVGTDIGGFVGSPSGELYTRWLELGVFTPLMRTHTEINSTDQEPWSYGPEFEAINKKTIELRYKLLPYIYDQFYKAANDGTPIMRPLVFDYPDDNDTYWENTEFLFGDAFLVAPALWPNQTTRDVRLPAGDWFNYWTGEKFAGPKHVRVDAPIDRIPLFVKAGAIIPTQQIVQYTDEEPANPLTLEIYPSAGSTVLYEDDGISFDYRRNNYACRRIEVSSSPSERRVIISQVEGSYSLPNRAFLMKMNAIERVPATVTVNGLAIQPNTGLSSSKPAVTGWSFDRDEKVLWISLDNDTPNRREIRASF